MADIEVDVASGQPKRRTFRKFSFRGVDLDAPLDMNNKELIKLFHARARRRFQRGLKRKPLALFKKLRKASYSTGAGSYFSYTLGHLGRKELSDEENLKLGSYNALLQSSVSLELRLYKAEPESFESSHKMFRMLFPRSFTWEVLSIYSGPQVSPSNSGTGAAWRAILRGMYPQESWWSSLGWLLSRHSRSQSCPFCRDCLKRVNWCDLWIYTDNSDIVDMAAIARENLRRFFMYVDKLPLVVPDALFDTYDYRVR